MAGEMWQTILIALADTSLTALVEGYKQDLSIVCLLSFLWPLIVSTFRMCATHPQAQIACKQLALCTDLMKRWKKFGNSNYLTTYTPTFPRIFLMSHSLSNESFCLSGTSQQLEPLLKHYLVARRLEHICGISSPNPCSLR